jgi:hypothetical protein
MMAWACSEPRQDLEPDPPTLEDQGDSDTYSDQWADSLRELAQERRRREDDSRELARLER